MSRSKGGTWAAPIVPDGMTPCRECNILTSNDSFLCDDCLEERSTGHVKLRYNLRQFRGQAEKPGTMGQVSSTGGSYGDGRRRKKARLSWTGGVLPSWKAFRGEDVVLDDVFEVVK